MPESFERTEYGEFEASAFTFHSLKKGFTFFLQTAGGLAKFSLRMALQNQCRNLVYFVQNIYEPPAG